MTIRNGFHLSLLLATMVPYVLLALVYFGYSGFAYVLGILAFFATGHVPATLLLLRDRNIREFFVRNTTTMIWVPVLIMVLTFYVFIVFPQNVGGSAPHMVFWFMLAYTLWQTWHFAKQNYGVFSFSCIASRRAPPSIWEKRIIFAGGIAGLLGVYQAVGTGLQTAYYPSGDFGLLDTVFMVFRYTGIALLCACTAGIVLLLVQAPRMRSVQNVLLLLTTSLFFVPYFFVGDELLAFASFTWAHGLQYLVFLMFHAVGMRLEKTGMNPLDDLRSNAMKASPQTWLVIFFAVAFFAFCGWLVRDLIVWATSFVTFTAMFIHVQANYPLTLNVVVAFLTGITMVHFVWDSRLWRFREPDRRKWMAENYRFLFEKPAERPV